MSTYGRKCAAVPAGAMLTCLDRKRAAVGSTSLLGDFAETTSLPGNTWTYVGAFAEVSSFKLLRH